MITWSHSLRSTPGNSSKLPLRFGNLERGHLRRIHKGVAQLEFVLCLPFLLALFAFLASVGFASLNKAGVALQVRREVWQLREDDAVERLAPSRPLSIASSLTPLAGGIYKEAERPVSVFPWLSPASPARSGAAVLGGTWDHAEINDFEDLPKGPHFSLIERVAGGDGAATRAFTKLLSFVLGGLPNQDEIDQAQKDKEKATKDYEAKREQIKKEIERVRAELKQLEEERDKLIRARDDKQRDRDDKAAELKRLRERAATLNPVPADLKARIEQLESQIAELDRQIDALNRQIELKNRQIIDKRRELKDWEEALQRTDNELGGLPS